MGVPDTQTGNIFAIANAGLAVGALFWGLAADIIGRKWAFNLTCLITSVFGLLLVRLLHSKILCLHNCSLTVRLRQSTTILRYAPSISWRRSAWEVTFQSTRLSHSSFYPTTVASSSHFSQCGSPSVSLLHLSLRTVQPPNQHGVATPNCFLAMPLAREKPAAPSKATWAGATT
jgi:MFS family permease